MLFIYMQSDQSLARRVRAQSTLPHSTLGAGPNQLHVATYKVPRPYNNTDSLQPSAHSERNTEHKQNADLIDVSQYL